MFCGIRENYQSVYRIFLVEMLLYSHTDKLQLVYSIKSYRQLLIQTTMTTLISWLISKRHTPLWQPKKTMLKLSTKTLILILKLVWRGIVFWIALHLIQQMITFKMSVVVVVVVAVATEELMPATIVLESAILLVEFPVSVMILSLSGLVILLVTLWEPLLLNQVQFWVWILWESVILQ